MQDFHIWDLPHDRTYVKFEKEFQKGLFLKAKNKYGSWPKLAKKLNCNDRSVMNWAYGKNFMTLDTALRVASLTNTEFGVIEEKLFAIATGRKTKINGKRGTPVYTPKFPIKLTPQLARVLARFMGDGCIKTGWYYESVYYNKETELINAMIYDVESVFGNSKHTISIDNGVKCVRFPNIVGLSIVTMFGSVDTFKARIPETIIDSNEEIMLAFLQAYFDDEGTVDVKHPLARYYTSNKTTAESLTHLLRNIGIKSGNGKTDYIIGDVERSMFHVNITGKDNVRNFALKIKPFHNRKKELLSALLGP